MTEQATQDTMEQTTAVTYRRPGSPLRDYGGDEVQFGLLDAIRPLWAMLSAIEQDMGPRHRDGELLPHLAPMARRALRMVIELNEVGGVGRPTKDVRYRADKILTAAVVMLECAWDTWTSGGGLTDSDLEGALNSLRWSVDDLYRDLLDLDPEEEEAHA